METDRTPVQTGATPLPRVNILLVDDQPPNLLALEALLSDLNQNLVRALTGEEALDRLAEQDFAVVLLDVRLPGLDGLQTAQRLRARKRSCHTPIIFLTAHDDQLAVEQAYALGAVDYLVKPLSPTILRAKVLGFIDLFQQAELIRRQAVTARQNEERFRLLVEEVKEYAIFMLDPEGRVASWNAGAKRLTGYTAAAIRGQHFSLFYPKEAVARGWPDHELQVARNEGRFEDEGWRVRQDGSRYWANVVITALKDAEGNLHGFAKLTRDMTERKQKEKALLELQRDLEKRVQERTAALAASNQALQAEVVERRRAEESLRQADRRKDEFLAMLGHELRNPLAPIVNVLHLLRLGTGDAETREQARAMIERQVRHLTRLVDDLLDVSRITRGKIETRRERLDLAQVVRTAAEDHRPLLEQAGLQLTVTMPAAPVWVSGDPTRLAQVLGNLLDNTIKFKNGGGQVDICLAVDESNAQAVLTVRDRGIGIAPEVLPLLFEPFAQADRSLDRARGGLGLGLAVVKGLVELHGGTVRVDSAGIGQGAEFTVRLPLKEEKAALSTQPSAPQRPATRPLRILIVEDARDAADSLRMLLQVLGHEARVAYTGKQGVSTARAWRPDIVLCDIGLPELDGYGVANELRHDPTTAGARMIAITGYGQEEDRRLSRQAGFDYHLTKPVDPDDLERLLVAV